jgi:osmotically-inducible protein OsmY
MRTLILTALLGLAAVNLSGCVPIVAVGVGAGALMADDRRTAGTYLMDEEIELKAAGRIHEAYKEGVHVNVTSFNRRVLLTGETADAAARAKVAQIARDVPNVRDVQNEILLAGVSTIMARSNDAYITTKVKARFLDDRRFSANRVKVVTEAATVFLMGLVTREEGNAAAEVAAKTSGVAKVVKVFEYIE